MRDACYSFCHALRHAHQAEQLQFVRGLIEKRDLFLCFKTALSRLCYEKQLMKMITDQLSDLLDRFLHRNFDGLNVQINFGTTFVNADSPDGSRHKNYQVTWNLFQKLEESGCMDLVEDITLQEKHEELVLLFEDS